MIIPRSSQLLGLVCAGAALLLSACSGPSVLPRMDGPAKVVQQGRAFYALFDASQDVGYLCPNGTTSGPAVSANGHFSPTPSRVSATEDAFREVLRRSIFANADAVAPDSTVTVTAFYGNTAVPREVSGTDLRRMAEREYDRSLGWDRQYAGVVDARGDSAFVVNVVNPVLKARKVLADQWVIPPPAASAYVQTVAYDVATGAATPLCSDSGS